MVFPFPSCGGASGAANSGPSVLLGRSRVTLSRLWCYAGIRQVLPGSQSHRCPETHRRGQPLQSEARNAKNAPESAICGVLRKRSTATGSGSWLVPISNPRSAPRRVGRTTIPPILCRNFVLTRFADLIRPAVAPKGQHDNRSEEHTSEL